MNEINENEDIENEMSLSQNSNNENDINNKDNNINETNNIESIDNLEDINKNSLLVRSNRLKHQNNTINNKISPKYRKGDIMCCQTLNRDIFWEIKINESRIDHISGKNYILMFYISFV